MKAFLDAIYTKLTGTSAITSVFTGGVYLEGTQPDDDDAAKARLIYRVVSAPNFQRFGSASTYGDIMMDFIGVGATGTTKTPMGTLLTNMEAVATALDAADLSISGKTLTNVQRISDVIPLVVDSEDETGEQGCQANVQYLFSVG